MSSVFDNGDTPPKAVKVDPPSGAKEEKKKRGRPPGSVNQATVTQIEEALQELLVIPAGAFAMMGDDYCAWILAGEGGPGQEWARSWARLAKTSPAVRRVLMKMMQGGAWGGVISSSLMVAIPIAAHHNVLPERFNLFTAMMGIQPPPEEAAE